MNKKGGNALEKSNVAIHCFEPLGSPHFEISTAEYKLTLIRASATLNPAGTNQRIKQSPSCVESGPH